MSKLDARPNEPKHGPGIQEEQKWPKEMLIFRRFEVKESVMQELLWRKSAASIIARASSWDVCE